MPLIFFLRTIFKPLFFFNSLFILLALFPLLANNNELNPINYELEISKAQTSLEQGKYSEAGLIAKRLMKLFPLRPDAFYVYGLLHQRAGLDDMALRFFSKAASLSHPMVFAIDRVNLEIKKTEIYQKKRDMGNIEKQLNKIIDLTQAKEGDFYSRVRAQAYFRLGEINYKKRNWAFAIEQFLNAIKNNYDELIVPYLYLANYYADFPEREIRVHFEKYLPAAYNVIPEKQNSFIFYYRVYRQLYRKNSLDFLKNSFYKSMHERVQNYFYSISGISNHNQVN